MKKIFIKLTAAIISSGRKLYMDLLAGNSSKQSKPNGHAEGRCYSHSISRIGI